MELEHISHIVRVGVKATCLHLNPWHILKEKTEPATRSGIQLNRGEVHTHASYLELTKTLLQI